MEIYCVSLSIYLFFGENSSNPDEDQPPLKPPHSLRVNQVQDSVYSSLKSWKCQRSRPHHHQKRNNISGLNVAAEAEITRRRNDPKLQHVILLKLFWLVVFSTYYVKFLEWGWSLTYRQDCLTNPMTQTTRENVSDTGSVTSSRQKTPTESWARKSESTCCPVNIEGRSVSFEFLSSEMTAVIPRVAESQEFSRWKLDFPFRFSGNVPTLCNPSRTWLLLVLLSVYFPFECIVHVHVWNLKESVKVSAVVF